MEIENVMTAKANQFLPVDGKILYYALKRKGFKIWKVGNLYYLMDNRHPVNVETTYALNQVFYQLGMLPEENALIGAPHTEFMKLVRKYSERFDRHVSTLLTPEQKQEYEEAKKASVSHRVFFRKWMLANQQSVCIATNN